KPFVAEELIAAIQARLQKQESLKQIHKQVLEKYKYDMQKTFSHEFNTPLTGILGASEFLLSCYDDLEKNEVKEMLEAIYFSGKRLKRMVDKNIFYQSLLQKEKSPNLKPENFLEI